MKLKAVFNWSGGKDSALALYKILKENTFDIISLLTTINEDTSLSSMHNIPFSLLQKQADSIGIPLYIVKLKSKGDMSDYENAMSVAVKYFKNKNVSHFIFGDIFLNDVKKYREDKLKPFGIEVIEPLWGKSSQEVIQDFLNSGLKTIIVTTMAEKLGEEYIGKVVDQKFIDSLPQDVDICGENGEYHSFCFSGEIFNKHITFSLGDAFKKTYPITLDNGTTKEYSYWFADIKDL